MHEGREGGTPARRGVRVPMPEFTESVPATCRHGLSDAPTAHTALKAVR
jgi:hypothetical protein